MYAKSQNKFNNTPNFTIGINGVYFICKINAKLNTLNSQIFRGIIRMICLTIVWLNSIMETVHIKLIAI